MVPRQGRLRIYHPSRAGPDVFLHRSAIKGMNTDHRIASVTQGEEVDFYVRVSKRGPVAMQVTGPGGVPVKGDFRAAQPTAVTPLSNSYAVTAQPTSNPMSGPSSAPPPTTSPSAPSPVPKPRVALPTPPAPSAQCPIGPTPQVSVGADTTSQDSDGILAGVSSIVGAFLSSVPTPSLPLKPSRSPNIEPVAARAHSVSSSHQPPCVRTKPERRTPKFRYKEPVVKWVGGIDNGEWKPFEVVDVDFEKDGSPKYHLRSFIYKGIEEESQWSGEAGMRCMKHLYYLAFEPNTTDATYQAIWEAMPKPELFEIS